jgi:hypothetical protein
MAAKRAAVDKLSTGLIKNAEEEETPSGAIN